MENLDVKRVLYNFKDRKVFITGHTGFKGSWLLKLLDIAGADILGYSLEPKTNPSLFKSIEGKLNLKSIIGDINDFNNLNKEINKFQPEFIFHLAAQPLVRHSYKETLETFQTNVMGTANVLESCKSLKNKCVIICVTTDKVYQNNEWEYPYRESDILGGNDPYSASKAAAELVIQSYRKSFFLNENVQIASVRAGNVIGGGDWSQDRLIPDILRSINNGQKVKLRNPNAVRPWQHVLDPLFGYLKLAQAMFQSIGKFNVSWNFGPEAHEARTVGQVTDAIFKLFKIRVGYLVDNFNHPHEAGLLKLDISKAKSELEWAPVWNTEQAIYQTAHWYAHYYRGAEANELMEKNIQDFINKPPNLMENYF
jgi:CDP-glucose 4,6-dehydratase